MIPTTATPAPTAATVEDEVLRIGAFQACGDCPDLTPWDRRMIFRGIELEIRTRRQRTC